LEYGGGTPPTPALIASYGFDEGSGTAPQDASGNGHHGSFASGVNYVTNGKYNKALSFNGSGPVTVPDATTLDLTRFTLEAWVYPTSAISDFEAVIVKNYKYWLYAGSDGYCATGAMIGGYSQGSSVAACYSTILPLNTWSHIAATYDGTTVKLYLNANLVATASGGATLDATTESLMIGGSEYEEYFTGVIDEVRIYDGAITQAQIQTDKDTPINPLSPAPPRFQIASGGIFKIAPGATRKIGQ
jgi:hypothetical protein